MKTRYKLQNKRSVDIVVNEHDFSVEVIDAVSGDRVGGMEFRMIEDDGHGTNRLRLTWAYLDQAGSEYKYQGIGRCCLELVRQVSGMEIVAAEDDGLQKDDGSHLTGDAPEFVAKMREEGLIT